MRSSSTGLSKRLSNLLPPFKPGESGRNRHSKRYLELHGKFAAELGKLNAIDTALLSQAVALICRAERPGTAANDAVRCLNASRRILGGLKAHRAVVEASSQPTLADILRGAPAA
jgi:hypothetical protein